MAEVSGGAASGWALRMTVAFSRASAPHRKQSCPGAGICGDTLGAGWPSWETRRRRDDPGHCARPGDADGRDAGRKHAPDLPPVSATECCMPGTDAAG